jgi:hypothetical protein
MTRGRGAACSGAGRDEWFLFGEDGERRDARGDHPSVPAATCTLTKLDAGTAVREDGLPAGEADAADLLR